MERPRSAMDPPLRREYGRVEVESWFWEVWNEPNIGYWHGTSEEFLKLHDLRHRRSTAGLASAKVGGADSAGSGGRFTATFSNIVCAAPTSPPVKSALPSIHFLPRQRCADLYQRPMCAWESPPNSERSTMASAMIAFFP